MPSPDHVHHLPAGPAAWHKQFVTSAAALGLIEAASFVLAAIALARLMRSMSERK